MVELDSAPGDRRQILAEIAGERGRQVFRGYDAAHDDAHNRGEIAAAAACFAIDGTGRPPFPGGFEKSIIGSLWPWDPRFFKHRPRRDQLIIAAALLVAEIERLDRETTRRGS